VTAGKYRYVRSIFRDSLARLTGSAGGSGAARAKVLACRGQFSAARALLDVAQALVSPTSWVALPAETLLPGLQRTGSPGRRNKPRPACAALRLSEDRRATHFADQATATLASLTGHAGVKPT
jgi:hypothetical protein